MIYLDNAATTRVSAEVFEAMKPYFCEQYANPSAIYSFAGSAAKAVDEARRQSAALIGAQPNEIYFTAGGSCTGEERTCSRSAGDEVDDLCARFGIADRNLVKPGIGEATRVLLRRVPWKILVHSLGDEEHLGHIYQLAREKEVALEEYPLEHYRACGLIRAMADN